MGFGEVKLLIIKKDFFKHYEKYIRNFGEPTGIYPNGTSMYYCPRKNELDASRKINRRITWSKFDLTIKVSMYMKGL